MTNQQGRLRTRVAVFACVAAAALIVDQLTKAWAMAALSNGQTIRVIPGLLSFTLVRNPGASLGMGSGATWVISLLAVVACVALAVAGVRTVSMKWSVAISFAFAGALGNLIDRVMYADGFLDGKVVDFLNYGGYLSGSRRGGPGDSDSYGGAVLTQGSHRAIRRIPTV